MCSLDNALQSAFLYNSQWMRDVLTCITMNFSTGANHIEDKIDGLFEWCFSLDNPFLLANLIAWLATRWTLPTHCWWEYECKTRKGMLWNQCIDWTTFSCLSVWVSQCWSHIVDRWIEVQDYEHFNRLTLDLFHWCFSLENALWWAIAH